MAMESKATLRTVRRIQFGILSPDEIVSTLILIRLSFESKFVAIISHYWISFLKTLALQLCKKEEKLLFNSGLYSV